MSNNYNQISLYDKTSKTKGSDGISYKPEIEMKIRHLVLDTTDKPIAFQIPEGWKLGSNSKGSRVEDLM